MAGHGFAAYDPDQIQAVITITNGLAKTVNTELEGAIAQFKNDLITTDAVMGDCEYKEQALSGLVKSFDDVQATLDIQGNIDRFNAKVDEVSAKVGQTFNKNVQSADEAVQVLNSKAQQKASEIGTSKG